MRIRSSVAGPGKMFCSGERVFFDAAHEGGDKLGDARGIFAKRSRIDDGIAGVVIHIRVRRINPMHADSARFQRGDFAHGVGTFRIAAGGDSKDAYTMGKITALESRAVGVHWIYAPDADVNNNPGNPIINTRSFGEDPARVAEFVSAFVRGVEENGGLATAKHFPGHGDTAADSHIDLPVIRADRARLDDLELVPFRAAISMQ